MPRLLILERDERLRAEFRRVAGECGWEAAELPARAAEALEPSDLPAFDVALVTVEDHRDLETIDVLRREAPSSSVLAAGASPGLDVAIAAMKRGARDFLRKPFGAGRLASALAAALPERPRADAEPLLTRDPGMERVLRQIDAAAATEATVQIVGESGTGKDLLARRLHRRSARREAPFVVVNCAALPSTLAESELFGHEAGAFTGAREARLGQFTSADGGTVLLDEVSELSLELQPKLLRVLQEREVQPVGALSPKPVDVRVVATSQRPLAAESAAGRFREDLHYRLDVIVLQVPALRERPEDILFLAEHFLERFAEANRCAAPRLTDAARRALRRHPFRGNVRELENRMRRAVVLHPGAALAPEQVLPEAEVEKPSGFNLREVERQVIARSLAETGGNRTRASQLLGISVRTLRNKLKLYELA